MCCGVVARCALCVGMCCGVVARCALCVGMCCGVVARCALCVGMCCGVVTRCALCGGMCCGAVARCAYAHLATAPQHIPTQHDMLPQHPVCKYELNCEYCNVTLVRNKAP